MKVLLWILTGILMVDVGLVAVVATCAAVVRRRGPRAMRDPVTWWPMGSAQDAIDERPDSSMLAFDRRSPVTRAPVAPARVGGRRARRPAVVAVVAATIFAGTAFASPEVRHLVATAIHGVTGGFVLGSGEPGGDRAAGAGTASPVSQVPIGPDGGASPSSGGGPSAATPGPAMDPRPPGIPHGGVLAPAAPTGLTASAGSSSRVDLVWTGVGDEPGYRVERSPDGTSGWTTITDTAPGVTWWTDTGLSPGSTTYYRVVATNAGGDSPPSDVASATTPVDPASPTTVIAVDTSPSQIDLQWTDVGTETGYRVERSDGFGGWTTVATTGQDVTSTSDTGLAPGTTYSYRVFATNAAGDSAASEVASATTLPEPDDAVAPATPDGQDPVGALIGT